MMSELWQTRWARRELKRLFTMDYTKWHATHHGESTLCDIAIPLGLEGTFLPEWDTETDKVDCKKCRRLLDAPSSEHEEADALADTQERLTKKESE